MMFLRLAPHSTCAIQYCYIFDFITIYKIKLYFYKHLFTQFVVIDKIIPCILNIVIEIYPYIFLPVANFSYTVNMCRNLGRNKTFKFSRDKMHNFLVRQKFEIYRALNSWQCYFHHVSRLLCYVLQSVIYALCTSIWRCTE